MAMSSAVLASQSEISIVKLTNHSSPAQRVDAVDVDAAAGTFQHSVKNILAVEKIF